MEKIIPFQDPNIQNPSVNTLKLSLAQEIQKMINAGHLRTGYSSSGMIDNGSKICGDDLMDYWHNPGDTTTVLIQALPYLPTDLQQQTKEYLQSEFLSFPPYTYNHIGWKDGAARRNIYCSTRSRSRYVDIGSSGESLGLSWLAYSPRIHFMPYGSMPRFLGEQRISTKRVKASLKRCRTIISCSIIPTYLIITLQDILAS